MNLLIKGEWILVKNHQGSGDTGFLAVPRDNFSSGTVYMVPDSLQDELSVGQSVYFSNDFRTLKIGNEEYKAMKLENIVCVEV